MAVEEPQFVPIDITWDTAAMDHVVNELDVPGHAVEESAMSRRGQNFQNASGKGMPNRGEVHTVMICEMSGGRRQKVKSTLQVTDVTRPLWSIPKLLDNQIDEDSEVVFKKKVAFARDSKGRVFASATRKPNGLYVSNFQLANPRHPGFGRPAQP